MDTPFPGASRPFNSATRNKFNETQPYELHSNPHGMEN